MATSSCSVSGARRLSHDLPDEAHDAFSHEHEVACLFVRADTVEVTGGMRVELLPAAPAVGRAQQRTLAADHQQVAGVGLQHGLAQHSVATAGHRTPGTPVILRT